MRNCAKELASSLFKQQQEYEMMMCKRNYNSKSPLIGITTKNAIMCVTLNENTNLDAQEGRA
ncbi:hypothetical protein CVS40_5560 [Lucilia cuprina]|nr:hypothetical protein CVS40_5560 [Lucilia cuprina]